MSTKPNQNSVEEFRLLQKTRLELLDSKISELHDRLKNTETEYELLVKLKKIYIEKIEANVKFIEMENEHEKQLRLIPSEIKYWNDIQQEDIKLKVIEDEVIELAKKAKIPVNYHGDIELLEDIKKCESEKLKQDKILDSLKTQNKKLDSEIIKIDNEFVNVPETKNEVLKKFGLLRTRNIKVVLCGAGGVGKTAFVTKLATGEFEKKYNPTVGVDVRHIPLDYITGDKKDMKTSFEIWDTAGQELFQISKESNSGYYDGAHAFIVMFDYTSMSSYLSAADYCSKIRKMSKAPIIVIGSKIDCDGRKVKLSKGKFKTDNIEFCNVSSKTSYGLTQPFTLIKKMTK